MFNDSSGTAAVVSLEGATSPSAHGAANIWAIAPKPIDRLFYPKEIAGEIGICKQRIAFLKHKGCRFVGRKTTIRWVREFLSGVASGAVSSAQL